MVIIRFTGGLGNQMFQYAAGRAASLRNNVPLVIDASFFETDITKQVHETNVHIELFPNIHKLNLPIIHKKELHEIRNNYTGFILNKIGWLKSKLGLQKYFELLKEDNLLSFKDYSFMYKAEVLYMASDWQNEKYFIDFNSIIRNDFIFPKLKEDSINHDLLKSISDTNSVSIHVRRGDYINSSIHTPLSSYYYNEAVEWIQKHVSNPVFFIFSDDIDWCKKKLHIQNAIFVSHNNKNDSYIDMHLMSVCKNNIIANSSFSWWGAWLNNNPYKLVVAPDMWLENFGIPSTNIVPDNWQIIK